MFVPFLYELRDRGVKVGAQEALSLAQALALELHRGTLDGFYEVARALCVHREQDLDAFDRAFAHHFHGVPDEALALTDELLQWLEQPAARRQLIELEKELLERIDLAEARDRLRMRLAEQRTRHDRGNRWVGTAGTSPHGSGGAHPPRVKGGQAPGGRGALEVASERHFRDLRSDVTLDTRQIEVALRRLRAFVREGALDELDVETTIDKTARNAGELEIALRPPRRSNLRVLLLLDVGGSMDPRDPGAAAPAGLRSFLAPDRRRRRADEPLGAAVERIALELQRGLGRARRRLAGASRAALPALCVAQPGAAGGLVRHGRGDSPDLSHVPADPGRVARGRAPLDEGRRAPLSAAGAGADNYVRPTERSANQRS